MPTLHPAQTCFPLYHWQLAASYLSTARAAKRAGRADVVAYYVRLAMTARALAKRAAGTASAPRVNAGRVREMAERFDAYDDMHDQA